MTKRTVTPANPRRVCPECGAAFIATNGRQKFCTVRHAQDFKNAAINRAAILLPLAQVWRKSKRGMTPMRRYALNELCALLDLYAAEDRERGRDPALVVADRMARGWKAADVGT